jgi:murein L,D-transpeptidase YafK
MTNRLAGPPANLARHRNGPHLAFWQMLKVGNDHFETT